MKSIAMLFWTLIALALFLAWIILPIYIVYEIIFQLNVV